MPVTTVCYCTREDVQRALDFKGGVLSDDRIDRAIQSSARKIEGRLHRFFYPDDTALFFTWPNFQYADPWRLWLDRYDLVALTSLQSPSGTAIPLWQVFLEPVNKKPREPYRWIELDRSTVAAWGAGPTPQHSILIAGTWGYTAEADPAGTLTANVASGDAQIAVSDGSLVGVGDILIPGYGRGSAPFPAYPGTAGAVAPYTGERVLVTGRSAAATGLTQSGGGCTTASNADQALATTGTGTLNAGETILLDSEQMLVEGVTAGVATVKRAWNGTTLAAHADVPVYAYRLLSVLRGQLGTTAASWDSGTAVYRHRPPQQIRDLAIGLALDQSLQETSGYSRTVGAADDLHPASGAALSYLWRDAMTECGRKTRQRAI